MNDDGSVGRGAARIGGSRHAVIDLGSNSVRLVIYAGERRTPQIIFNEKAVLRLGRGLTQTGLLNPEGVRQAAPVMARFFRIASGLGADPPEVLATAAVRDATNGGEFLVMLRGVMPGATVTVLTGEEEAALSADGVFCGIPAADGILADIGGGSLELVRLANGRRALGVSRSLGVIRLSDRAGGSIDAARALVERDLADIPWLAEGTGRDLYLVGGAWRAIARVHMAAVKHPLAIVHHYAIDADAAKELVARLLGTPRKALDRLPGAPRRRAEDLPWAAVVLRRLLRVTGARRVVFSANGLREGWYLRRLPPALRAQDPLLAAARTYASVARDPTLAEALVRWTDPLFRSETPDDRRLREAACLMSELGVGDHPDYRAQQAAEEIMRSASVVLDHPSRAYLGIVLGLRYEAEPDAPFLSPVRPLLDTQGLRRAETLGAALRLAYALCGGASAVLGAASLSISNGALVLALHPGAGVWPGDGVERRLHTLAELGGYLDARIVELSEPPSRAA